MNSQLTAFQAWVRRPMVQDIGLAVLLLISSWILKADEVRAVVEGAPVVELTQMPSWVWWLSTATCVGAVAVRRKWPVPALLIATVATVAHMALIAGPTPADLAAPIILYTIASTRPRKFSLTLLGGTMVVAMAWSMYVVLDGKADGWLFEGPSDDTVAAPIDPPVDPTGAPPGPPPLPLVIRLGPTDWGGIPILGSVLVAGWAIGWSVQSRRAYLDELEARARDLERERDQQAALAVAAERSRITRELHDVVAHGLSVIVMQAQGGAAAFANRPSDTLAALDTIVETGRASLSDMRQVLAAVGPLDGSTHPVPGLEHLPGLVDQVRQAGTPVQLHIEGSPEVLATSVDVSAYRIVQEALTNTMKHAGPNACAQVTLTYGKTILTVEVNDNGTAGPSPDGNGNGLRGMRERAELLGGELASGPGPNGGFLVRASLPLHREPTT